MIKFQKDMVRVEIFYMKSCTTALGGSIRVVDEENSTEEKEVYNRLEVPMAVVRTFKKRYKTSKYLHPVLIAVAYYGDSIIALERHPLGCVGERFSKGLNGELKEWTPAIKRNLENLVFPLTSGLTARHDWFFDGRYMFTFGMKMDEAVSKAQYLTNDGKFRIVECEAIGLHQLEEEAKLSPVSRTCLAYKAFNGQYAVSPPIWKDVSSVGQAKIKRSGYETPEDSGRELAFDKIDTLCAVNISFALKAAGDLSKHFGFEAIEPLQIPQLMIRLNTVNLPKVDPAVKATFDSGIKFTHALAWLLGYAAKADTAESYATIRSLLKYLTSKGVFYKSSFDPSNIFKKGHNLDTVPLRDKDEAKKKAAEGVSIGHVLDQIEERFNRQSSRTGNVIAGVLAVDDV